MNTAITETNINDNHIENNLYRGILAQYSNYLHIEGNTINNHTGIDGFYAGTGIDLLLTYNTTIHDNYLEGNGGFNTLNNFDEDAAVFSEAGGALVLTNNYVTESNSYGIRVQYQTDVIAEDNQLIGNVAGGAVLIFIEITSNGLVNNNVVDDAGWTGIFLDGTNNMIVTNNTVSNVLGAGVLPPAGMVQQNYYSASTLKIYNYNNEISNIQSASGV